MVFKSTYALKYQEKMDSNEQIYVYKIDISCNSKSVSWLRITARELTHLNSKGRRVEMEKIRNPLDHQFLLY